MVKKRPLTPVDNELIEKYSNKELLDELKLLNGNNENSKPDFLNAEFVLSEKEKQELMDQNIRNFDKNSRTFDRNLKISSDFKHDAKNVTTTRITRRMAKLMINHKIPKFIEQGEVINFCNGVRCPLGKCLNVTQICNGIIECRNGEDEMNC